MLHDPTAQRSEPDAFVSAVRHLAWTLIADAKPEDRPAMLDRLVGAVREIAEVIRALPQGETAQ